MAKIDYLVRILILKDRMQAWAGVASFCMMLYLFAGRVLESKIVTNYVPPWLMVSLPIAFLLLIAIIDMKYFMPATQAYYTRNNHEWQDFRNELKK